MSKDQSPDTPPTQPAADGPHTPSELALADTAYLQESPPQAATLPAS